MNDPSGLNPDNLPSVDFDLFWWVRLQNSVFAGSATYYYVPDPSPYIPATHPGIQLAQDHLTTISKGGFRSKEKCRAFFSKLIELNNLKISVDSLMDQLQGAASKAIHHVYDGPGSTTPIDADKFSGVDSARFPTVGDFFAGRSDIAFSQFNGAAIWIRQADWSGWTSPFTGGDSANRYGLGILTHELLHKQMVGGGFSHPQMESALKDIGSLSSALYRNTIGNSIGNICF
jgi:hypothetical protein